MARLEYFYAFLKYSLIVLNGILICCGLLLFCLGLRLKCGTFTIKYILGSFVESLNNLGYVCILCGPAFMGVGSLGCFAALKERRVILLTYFGIVTLAFSIIGGGTIYVLVSADEIEHEIQEAARGTLWSSYIGSKGNDLISKEWNNIMTHYKCCGSINGISDFRNSLFTNTTTLFYPKTCCVNMAHRTCDGVTLSVGMLHSESCSVYLHHLVKRRVSVISGVFGVSCLAKLISIIFSLVLVMKQGFHWY